MADHATSNSLAASSNAGGSAKVNTSTTGGGGADDNPASASGGVSGDTGRPSETETDGATSDEEEGGTTKVLAPKLKATLQRRVAKVKKNLAHQLVLLYGLSLCL